MKLILPAHNIPDSILPLNPPADSVLASSLPRISIYIPFAAGPRPSIPGPFFVETFICSSPGLLCIHPASQELTNHHGPQGYEKQCTWHFAGHFSWAKSVLHLMSCRRFIRCFWWKKTAPRDSLAAVIPCFFWGACLKAKMYSAYFNLQMMGNACGTENWEGRIAYVGQ